MVEGQGWYGDTPGHEKAALKGQAGKANNNPMKAPEPHSLHDNAELLNRAKLNLKAVKKELTEFNKSKEANITGAWANLRRAKEIDIRHRLQWAKDVVAKYERLEPQCNFSNEELKWLGYKNKQDYIEQHRQKVA